MKASRILRETLAALVVAGLVLSCSGPERPANDGDGVWTGIFDEISPLDLSGVNRLETKVGQRFASIMWFQDWSTGFATEKAEKASAAGYLPNVTWEPWFFGNQDKIHLKDIVAGTWDKFITEWGRGAAAFGKPLMVRWGHEFNGDWYPWSVAKNGSSPELYVQAYRRVHDLVTQAGAKNVIWVWCPNAESQPAQAWNNPTLAYPGDEYVDWIGIDGYDFDGIDTFASKFGRIYAQLTKAFDKPLYIGEMASGRKGADRAAWIDGMHQALVKDFPGIKGIVWFNINKERDWRLEESPESLEMAAKTFALPFYHSRPDSLATLAEIYHRDRPRYVESAAKLVTVERAQVRAGKLTRTSAGTPDWSRAAVVTVKDKSGLEGTVKIGWDATHLFFLVDLRDETPLKNPQKNEEIWNGDALEVCLSSDPTTDPERGFYTATDWQFGFSTGAPSQSVPPRTWEWSQKKAAVPGIVQSVKATADGYQMEVSLPWAAMNGFQPQAGMVLGFDLALDNGGPEGTRVGQWIWNGASSFYNNPSQWGTLLLSAD